MQHSRIRLRCCGAPVRCLATPPAAASSAVPFVRSTAPLRSPCVAAAAAATSHGLHHSTLACSTRTFYDKIREKRDGSDEGPDQMFEDFAKSPQRQRVPVELHKGNKDAVEGAEMLNQAFFVFLLFFLVGLVYYMNPFREDPYDRPEGYGVTNPTKNVYGSSDRV